MDTLTIMLAVALAIRLAGDIVSGILRWDGRRRVRKSLSSVANRKRTQI